MFTFIQAKNSLSLNGMSISESVVFDFSSAETPFSRRAVCPPASRLRLLAALGLLVVSLGAAACGDDAPGPTDSRDAGQERPDAGGTLADSGTVLDGGSEQDAGTEPNPPDAGEPPPPPAFTFNAPREYTIFFSPNSTRGFGIQVQRLGTFTGDITLSVEDIPPHVTTGQPLPLTIPGAESITSLTFIPDEFATYGRFPVKLVMVGGGQRFEHLLTLDIQHGQAALDSSFGTLGVVAPALGQPDVSINAMAVQPDGKWILVGSTGSTGLRDVLVARLLADGTPDSSFGTQGVVVRDICTSDDYVDAVTVLSDGRILVAGGAISGTNTCAGPQRQSALFVRLTASGELDTTFGGTGVRTFQLSTGIATLHAVAVDPSGNIVGAGTARNGDLDLLAIRLTPTGGLDTTFSGDGVASSDEGGEEDGLGVVIQGDGKVVVAGTSTDSLNSLELVRFNANGTRDSSFSFFSSNLSPDVVPRTLHLLSDGKLLIGGRATFSNGNVSAALVRVTSVGNEDPTFGEEGYRYENARFTGVRDFVVGTALLSGGEVVLATRSFNSGGASGVGVIHVSADGTRTLRSHRTDLPGEETPTAAALDANGFLRVAGVRTLAGQPSAPFVTRFWPY